MRTLARVTMWTDEVATNRKQVHLINSLWSADSGSEIRTLRLYELLSRNANVTLWSQYEVAAEIARGHRVSVIAPKRLRFPKSGIFVFIGAYFSYGRWPKCCPARSGSSFSITRTMKICSEGISGGFDGRICRPSTCCTRRTSSRKRSALEASLRFRPSISNASHREPPPPSMRCARSRRALDARSAREALLERCRLVR